MMSFSLAADGARSSATAALPGSKSPALTIDAIAKAGKPNKVIRKLGRPREKSLVKNSLDLDRPSVDLGVYYAASRSSYDAGSASHILADLTWNSSSARGGRRPYHHRSVSGTSQFSSRTSGSYNRNGGFQHPWQQTPRPYTPLGAANYQDIIGGEMERNRVSFADEEQLGVRSGSTLSNYNVGGTLNPPLQEVTVLDAKPGESLSLTINTDSLSTLPRDSNLPLLNADASKSPESNLESTEETSPSSSRESMDRIRNMRAEGGIFEKKKPLNELDVLHEARRRFEEKEAIKIERADRAHVRALEKKNLKEALKAEALNRKAASEAADHEKYGGDNFESPMTMEDFLNANYEEIRGAEARHKKRAKRAIPRDSAAYVAKHKAHNAWMTFMIWFRTRLLKISRKF
ncbi:hypothetical protein VC83_03236 [Pseudogymnoascus destructans]|uniref:Uncharacterized protein n=2 Tax=Pseudogymnoascus destructans TaxID=655981 RepID=L8FZ99_PSED2|nr:uncharacterized protein VC83_03236 [Pseudogymnoascus destructans]ELR06340.1 hypothetical protein GMDG_07931 [Pseudogymnoascus destructans 20631-21]OAF60648.1 hypothetical protein VC83_03236 [Pseudogymnoascus destructans]